MASLYSNAQMISLGLAPNDHPNYRVVLPDISDIHDLVYGKFGNILEVIFSSKGTQLDDLLKITVSENAPESVRNFASNLLSSVPALAASPNDDIAFETIVPRSIQSASEFEPYLDSMRQKYDEIVAQSRAAQQQQPSSQPNSD